MSLFYTNRDIPYQFQDEIKATEVETGLTQRAKTRRSRRFLKGPIPLPDIAAAACLPGKSLALFLAIHHQTDLTGKPAVTVPAKLLADFGISRSAKSRCLKLTARLKQLEAENARLKKLVAERDLEIEVMKEVAAKNW